jgi:glycerol-3-phosphate O-acyltransferase/dihydroxyacetone phosphate acyltransferase
VRVADQVLHRRDGVVITVGGVHPPAHIVTRGEGEEGEASPPAVPTEPPGHDEERPGGPGAQEDVGEESEGEAEHRQGKVAPIFLPMWLYPALPMVAKAAVRSYYRVTVAGGRVPSEGPALLVGNHNNSLIDPALVVLAADRPMRFLAKAPLFVHPMIGWFIRGVGSVPVYRVQDDPTKVGQNADTFRDAFTALAQGDAIGIFPEGVSHTGSQLVPLKTGAARIALGAAARIGQAFPIVPIGLVIPDRETYRSEVHVIIGTPCVWDDLALRGVDDPEAVRELTARIDEAMRAVTLNLEDWEDAPLVHAAEAVWRAEVGAASDPAAALDRLQRITVALRAMRDREDSRWREIADALQVHARALRRFGLTPQEVRDQVPVRRAMRWTVARLPLIVALPISLVAAAVFWVPTAITKGVADGMTHRDGMDAFATHRVLVGALVFLIWAILVGVGIGWQFGVAWGLVACCVQPPLGMAALAVGDRTRMAWDSMRTFFRTRRLGSQLTELRERQRQLARALQALYDETVERRRAPATGSTPSAE